MLGDASSRSSSGECIVPRTPDALPFINASIGAPAPNEAINSNRDTQRRISSHLSLSESPISSARTRSVLNAFTFLNPIFPGALRDVNRINEVRNAFCSIVILSLAIRMIDSLKPSMLWSMKA